MVKEGGRQCKKLPPLEKGYTRKMSSPPSKNTGDGLS